jgi:hypothetical protein
MRKRNFLIGALALAATAAIPATASATVSNQTLTETLSTSKLLSKGVGTPVITTLHTSATYSCPATDPAATLVNLTLPGLKVNPKGIPTCDPNSIQNITTAQAIAACPKSVIGSGSAHIDGVLPGGPKSAVVTPFLGQPLGAYPVLLLHVRVDELSVTQVLTAVVTKSGTGIKLAVTVPPIAGGHEVLTDFTSIIDKKTTIKKKVNGKTKKVKSRITTATCPKTKSLAYSGVFNFKDFTTQATSTLNASGSFPCKPVKPKK